MSDANYTGSWYPADPVWGMQGQIRCRAKCQPDIPKRKDSVLKNDIIETYIIKDEEADYFNMKSKNKKSPFMTDSFGRTYLKPSRYPIGNWGWFGPMNLRAGRYVPLQDYNYMRRLENASTTSPIAWTLARDYRDYYDLENTPLY